MRITSTQKRPSPKAIRSPSGIQGHNAGMRSGGSSPPEAEAKCEIVYNFFNVFRYKLLDLINIRARLGKNILQNHNTKFFED